MAFAIWEICRKMDILTSGWKMKRFHECKKGIIYLLKLTDLYAVVIEDENEVPIYTYSSYSQELSTIKYKQMKDKMLKGEPLDD